MGSSCSTANKIHISEPTILDKHTLDNLESPQKEYPVFSQNAKGLRQLAHYNKYPEEVKQTLEHKKYIS